MFTHHNFEANVINYMFDENMSVCLSGRPSLTFTDEQLYVLWAVLICRLWVKSLGINFNFGSYQLILSTQLQIERYQICKEMIPYIFKFKLIFYNSLYM
jgi:hypothetical protein